jgi:alpha-L-rhamnosidase
MTYAKAHHKSLYGPVASNWSLQDGRFLLEVELPPNTTATISLPQTSLEKVTEGRKPLREAAGILRSSQKGRIAEIEVGSGSYQFSCPIEP